MEERGDAAAEPARYDGQGAFRTLLGVTLGWIMDTTDLMLLALLGPDIGISLGFSESVWNAGYFQLVFGAQLAFSTLGAVIFGMLGDRIGRKKALVIDLLVFAASGVALLVSVNEHMFLAARILTGMALGGEWGLAAALITETQATKNRGLGVAIFQAGWPIGIIIAALFAMGLRSTGFSLFPGLFWWKTAFLVELFSIPIALYIWRYVPQSQHWLSKKKDHVDIMKALGPLAKLFRGRQLVRTLKAMTLTSVGFFAFYIVWTLVPNELVAAGDITRDQKFMLAALAGLAGIPGNLSFGYVSDWLKWKNARKKLFTFYCIIFATSTVLIPVAGNNIPFLAALLCMFQFSCGGFSSFGALFGELFHTSYKATGTNVCYNIGRTFAGMMQMAAAVALFGAALGWSLLMAASVLSCILILLDSVIMWSFPDTEGRSVDELDGMYENENKAQEKHLHG